MIVPPFPEKRRFEKTVHAQQRYVTINLAKEGWLRSLFTTQGTPKQQRQHHLDCLLEMQNLRPDPDLQNWNMHIDKGLLNTAEV